MLIATQPVQGFLSRNVSMYHIVSLIVSNRGRKKCREASRMLLQYRLQVIMINVHVVVGLAGQDMRPVMVSASCMW